MNYTETVIEGYSYTPTTEAIRGRIIQRGIGWGFYGLDEFDRWLATHDAEKRAEWEAEPVERLLRVPERRPGPPREPHR